MLQVIGDKIKEQVLDFLDDIDSLKPQVFFAIAENPIDGTGAAELFACAQSQIKRQ